mmetsp:Transcript_106673/g.298650  ORF Transcript_106673/g.298650 Transcript_106673/m.298650 type:complete len:140 (-) Transcript_106673:265-684(-)
MGCMGNMRGMGGMGCMGNMGGMGCMGCRGGCGMMPMMMGCGGARPGDWVCPNSECQDVNFAKNEVCRKCSTPKPAMPTATLGMGSGNKVVFKQGDWICPNPECQDMQFERNVVCRKCGTAKPDGTGSRGRSRSPTRLAM